jgi:hypothetical protein
MNSLGYLNNTIHPKSIHPEPRTPVIISHNDVSHSDVLSFIKCHILTLSPLRAPTSSLLQFLLGIQQSGLDPIPISSIAPNTLAVEKSSQGALDLLIDILQLRLVFLNLFQNAPVDDSWQRGSSCPHRRTLRSWSWYAATAILVANLWWR